MNFSSKMLKVTGMSNSLILKNKDSLLTIFKFRLEVLSGEIARGLIIVLT